MNYMKKMVHGINEPDKMLSLCHPRPLEIRLDLRPAPERTHACNEASGIFPRLCLHASLLLRCLGLRLISNEALMASVGILHFTDSNF